MYLQYCISAKQSKKITKITLAVRTDEYFLNSYQQLFKFPTVREHNFAIVPSKEVEASAVKNGKQTQTQY